MLGPYEVNKNKNDENGHIRDWSLEPITTYPFSVIPVCDTTYSAKQTRTDKRTENSFYGSGIVLLYKANSLCNRKCGHRRWMESQDPRHPTRGTFAKRCIHIYCAAVTHAEEILAKYMYLLQNLLQR